LGMSKLGMSKKERERATLELVYDGSAFSITDSDKPDFDLRRHRQDYMFGVEVTDFYISESNARIANIRGYATGLLAGGEHLHRDDIEALKVVDCAITAPDGTVKERTKGIFQRRPSLKAYLAGLLDLINEKNRLAGLSPGSWAHQLDRARLGEPVF
jgi:hypothetical protein